MTVKASALLAASLICLSNACLAAPDDTSGPPDAKTPVVWTPPSDASLWYDAPASDPATEGLPLGDAVTCCRITGGVSTDDTPFLAPPNAHATEMPVVYPKYLPENLESEAIELSFPDQAKYSDYHRDLDLTDAVAHVSYTSNGIHYSRAYFWSAPDRAVVIQCTADKKASYSGSLELVSQYPDTISTTDDTVYGSGSWSSQRSFASEVRIEHDGGRLTTNGHEVDFKGCDSITLIGASDSFQGAANQSEVADRISAASIKIDKDMLDAHIQSYQALYNPFAFKLSGTDPDRLAIPLDRRRLLASDGKDADLESIFINYLKYQRICAGATLPPGYNMPRLTGSDLSGRVCLAMTDGNAQPNLLLQRIDVLYLDQCIAQGIEQSLVAYNNGELDLLPNLPPDWTVGYATGLTAGPDFTVDITWVQGRLATVEIHSLTGKSATVKYGAMSAVINPKAGRIAHLGSSLNPEL